MRCTAPLFLLLLGMGGSHDALAMCMLAGVRVPTAGAQPSHETIGLFFDDGCGTCSTTMAPGEHRTLEIRAVRGGYTSQFGLAGASFRVVGLPSEWWVTCSPNPAANLILGQPFGAGAAVGFPSGIPGSCVSLYVCTIIATTPATVHLKVQGGELGGCGPVPCPCVLCDCPPLPSGICGTGGEAIINGTRCSVGVEGSTWGQVKRLYN